MKGEIIYCIAGVVILYNVDERIQRFIKFLTFFELFIIKLSSFYYFIRFYLGHTDDVKVKFSSSYMELNIEN
jgi:hypothetical protein